MLINDPPRTYVVQEDAGYVTSTSYGNGTVAARTTVTTVAPDRAQPG